MTDISFDDKEKKHRVRSQVFSFWKYMQSDQFVAASISLSKIWNNLILDWDRKRIIKRIESSPCLKLIQFPELSEVHAKQTDSQKNKLSLLSKLTFALLLQTKERLKREMWNFLIVIAPYEAQRLLRWYFVASLNVNCLFFYLRSPMN